MISLGNKKEEEEEKSFFERLSELGKTSKALAQALREKAQGASDSAQEITKDTTNKMADVIREKAQQAQGAVEQTADTTRKMMDSMRDTAQSTYEEGERGVQEYFKPTSEVRVRDVLRELPGEVKEMVAPSYGYTPEQYNQLRKKQAQEATAKGELLQPTDIGGGMRRMGAETVAGMGQLGAMGAQFIGEKTGLQGKMQEAMQQDSTEGKVARTAGDIASGITGVVGKGLGALEEYGQPKNIEEAQVQQLVNVGTLFSPMGAVTKVAKTGKALTKGLVDTVDPNQIDTLIKETGASFSPDINKLIANTDNAEDIKGIIKAATADMTDTQKPQALKDLIYGKEAPQAKVLNKGELQENIAQSSKKMQTQMIEAVGGDREKVNEALSQIWTEMSVSKPGQRHFVDYGADMQVIGQPSTFPEWVPPSLRSSKDFAKVTDSLVDVDELKYPAGASTKLRALMDVVFDRVDNMIGSNTRGTREEILNNFDQIKDAPKGKPKPIKETPKVIKAPEVTETPQTPQTPQTPTAPKTPQAPEAPKTPEAKELSTDEYLKQEVIKQQEKKKQTAPSIKETAKEATAKTKEAFIDRFTRIENPVTKASALIGKKKLTPDQIESSRGLFKDDDAFKSFMDKSGEKGLRKVFAEAKEAKMSDALDRRIRQSSLASTFIEDSGLRQTLKDVDKVKTGIDSRDAFDQYLVARHATNLVENYPKRRAGMEKQLGELKEGTPEHTSLKRRLNEMPKEMEQGRNVGMDKKLLNDYKDFEPMANKITEASHKLLDYLVETGMRSKGFVQNLKEMYPTYVPLKKMFTENELKTMSHNMSGGVGGGIAGVGEDKLIKKLTGKKEGDITASPVESILDNINLAYRQGEMNRVGQEMLKNIDDYSGDIKVLKEGEKATNGISVWKNGEEVKLDLTPEIYKAVKELSKDEMNVLEKGLSFLSRVFKTGTTGMYLPFIPVNMSMDVAQALMNSPRKMRTLGKFANGMWDSIRHGKQYQKAKRAGAVTTSFDIYRKGGIESKSELTKYLSSKDFVKHVATGGKGIKGAASAPIRAIEEAFNGIENIISRSEEVTRMSLFDEALQNYTKKGLSNDTATILAADHARNITQNFLRRGNIGRWMNLISNPYFNAALQSTRGIVKAGAKRPLSTATAMVGIGGMGIAIAEMQDQLWGDKYQAMLNDTNDREKANYLHIPTGNRLDYNKDTRRWEGDFVKFRVPPTVAVLADVMRRKYNSEKGKEEMKPAMEAGEELASSLLPIDVTSKQGMVGSIIPNPAKPFLENYVNKKLYYNSPLLNRTQEGVEKDLPLLKENDPEAYKQAIEQLSRKNTSEVAKTVGSALGMAPVKIDNIIAGIAGRAVAEPLQGKSPFEFRNILETRGGEEVNRIYDKKVSKEFFEDEQYKELDTEQRLKAIAKRKRELLKEAKVEAYLKTGDIKDADHEIKKLYLNQKVQEAADKAMKAKSFAPAKEYMKEMTELELGDDFKGAVQKEVGERKAGITLKDKTVKAMGVANGDRADYIWKEIKDLPKEEQKKVIMEYKKKKVVTKTVFKQLLELRK